MNTNVDALKALYVALGGMIDDVEDFSLSLEVINAIAQLVQGGGGSSSLPDVTTEDNGKVLAVVEGAWDKADPSGGGALTFRAEGDEDGYRLTKTFGEIFDAFKSGKMCLLENVYSDEQATYGIACNVGWSFNSYNNRYSATVTFYNEGTYNAEAGTLDALRAEYPFMQS